MTDNLTEAKRVLHWMSSDGDAMTAQTFALVSIAESLATMAGPAPKPVEEYDVPESYYVDHDTGSAYWLGGPELYFAPLMQDGTIAWGDASEVDGRADQSAIDYCKKLAKILIQAERLTP